MLMKVKTKIAKVLEKKYLKSILRIQCSGKNIIRCGNGYGGFDVVTDILDEINSKKQLIVYSFGIGEDLSFSEDLYKRWNCDIYAFDPTPKAINYVKQSKLVKQEKFHFYEWGISDKDEIAQFHIPKDEIYVPEYLVDYKKVEEISGSLISHADVQGETIDVEVKTLKTIIKSLGHTQIDLLKMDIEGAEFAVIGEILDSGVMFKELCLEIHNRFFDNGNELLKNMIDRLNKSGFYIASVAQSLTEVTFIYGH